MNIIFKNSFLKDIKKLKDKNVKVSLKLIINEFKNKQLHEIKGLKKLFGYEGFYRIRIGNYRLGLKIETNEIIFVRFLNRKDIYKYFP